MVCRVGHLSPQIQIAVQRYLFIALYYQIILQPNIGSQEMHQFTQYLLYAKIITFCRKDVQNMRIFEPLFFLLIKANSSRLLKATMYHIVVVTPVSNNRKSIFVCTLISDDNNNYKEILNFA